MKIWDKRPKAIYIKLYRYFNTSMKIIKMVLNKSLLFDCNFFVQSS